MKDQLQARARRLGSEFAAFTAGQKVVTVVAALAILIGGYLFATHTTQPSYSPLFTNLAPSDASAIVDKLNSAKEPYQLGAGGTSILVPQKDVYTERLAMSSAGLPSSAQSGFSLLNKEGVTTSEFKQQVDYQVDLQNELDRTIESIQGVQAAQVNLAIPQQGVFNDNTVKTTASVLVTTSASQPLSTDQVRSVVNLVAASVPGLSTDQVTVSDSQGNVLSAPGTGITAGGSGSGDQATQLYDSNLSAKIQAMLDKIVGPGHSVTTVNATLNSNNTTQHSLIYSAASGVPPLAEQSSQETYQGVGAGAGGVLGANATTPAPASPSGSGAGKYVNNSGTRNNAVNQTDTVTTIGPGTLAKLGVSVVLDKSAANAISTATVRQLVASVVTLVPNRDALAVATLPFDTSAATGAAAATAAATAAAAAAVKHAQLVSMLKTGGLVLTVLLVLLLAGLAGRRRRKRAERATAPEPQDDLDRFLSGLTDGPAPSDVPREPAMRQVPSTDDVASAANRQAVSNLAEDQPDDMARLLRTWLNSKGS